MKAQIFMTSLVALTLSLNIYLWSIYNNPFYGLLRVEPEAFNMDLEHFEFYRQNPDDMRWNKGMPDQKPGSVKKSAPAKRDLQKHEKQEKLESADREDRKRWKTGTVKWSRRPHG
ncbi:MAG: hypothetical protein H6677_03640 [Candidatus Obscuribacterales bacterium]|nr:hypothetical protein [Candidatus Obscuribacterales bacterium]